MYIVDFIIIDNGLGFGLFKDDVKGILNDASNLIYASNTIKVYATGLYPYPTTSEKKDFET